ncbi:MAG: hypothetical protein LIV24_03105 [Eubacterium sp.]|nr:hypothetical protein [Eubacterium sp.]
MGTPEINQSGILYFGTRAGEQKEKIRRALKKRAWFPGLFLITYPLNEAEQLDIIEARYLCSDVILRTLPPVVGVAIGRREAYQTVARIARDAWEETGTCDMKAFLRGKTGPAR